MDTIKEITEMEADLALLYGRMDRDRDAVYLSKYELKDTDGRSKLSGAVSVTMNNPGVFAHSVKAVLLNATQQITVEGLTPEKQKRIEGYANDCLYTVDQQLRRRQIASLRHWLVDHVVKRGPIGAKWTFQDDGTPSCVPFDMRYCPFRMSASGVEAFANHTRRSGPDIIREYQGVEGFDASAVNENERNLSVYDYWNSEINELWVDGRKVFEQENIYGLVPAVIRFPPDGSYLLDDGYLEHWAESIFLLVRDLYPEWNRLMSIQQSNAQKTFRPAYVHEVDAKTGEPQPYPDETNTNLEVLRGQKPEPLQQPDMTKFFAGAAQNFATALHEGSPSIIDMADMAGDRNAAWVAEQTQVREKIVQPRSETIQWFLADSIELLVREYRVQKFKDPKPLGRRGGSSVYTPEELGDPDNYTIEARYMPDNPRQKLANRAIAIALKDTFSQETILGDILQVEDVPGEIARIREEKAILSNPVLYYKDLAHRMVDEAKSKTGDEKKRALQRAGEYVDMMLIEIEAGAAPETPESGKANSQALMSLPGMMR